jgi:peptidyl-prolyl cis-trans isomerase D
MLDIMRRQKRLKIILWLVILSLALGMLLFFVPGVNVGGIAVDSSAATVDGLPIPMKDLEQAYRKTIEEYTNKGRNRIDPETLRAMGVSKQVLDNMIAGKVVEATAIRMGLKVTPGEIRQAVESHPGLQDQGKFIGIERYKAILAANNISVTDFEDDIRYMQLARKLQGIVTDSMDVSNRELKDEFSRTNQKTQVDYVLLKKDDFKNRIKPAETDLRAYFDGHKDAYKIKEKRRAQYLLIPTAQILPGIKVSDQEILAEWNQRPHDETVDASHILFRVDDKSKETEAKAKAEAVLKKAQAGEDFATLARTYSDDKESAKLGGFLGSFGRGQMVKEFEDAAFALKPGEVSGLVQTQYGYHIIKVERRNVPTLESSRSSILSSLQFKKAQEIAKQKAEEAARLAEKPKDLSQVGKNLGAAIELKETSFFGREDNPFELGISQALQNQVFELKEINSIGKAVEHPLGYAVPKLLEVQMPKPGEFAEARSKVEKDYIEAKSKELMQAEAKKLSEDAGKQGSLEKAAKGFGLPVKVSQPFSATEAPSPEIGTNPDFNSAAFALEPGSVSNPISVLDNVAVFQVKLRTPFDEQAFQKQKPELKQKLLQAKQEPYFQEFIRRATGDLEKAGKIRINAKALDQLQ